MPERALLQLASVVAGLARRLRHLETLETVGAGLGHAPVTLGIGSDPVLNLVGQELTLADVLTPAEHTAIGDGTPHHAAVSLAASAAAVLSLAAQQIDLQTQAANTMLAGPTTGADAAPAFRALVDADIPAAIARDAEVTAAIAAHAGIANAHHNPVTLGVSATALLDLSTQEIGLDNQAANRVFAGPASGAAATPTFRALVSDDLPAHDLLAKHSYTGGAALDLFGLSAADTLARITPSADPGAAAAVLRTDDDGLLQLTGLGIGTAGAAGQVVHSFTASASASLGAYQVTVTHPAANTRNSFGIYAQNNITANSGTQTAGVYGQYGGVTHTGGATVNTIYGFAGRVQSNSSGPVSNLRGIEGSAELGSSGSATITAALGVDASVVAFAGATGTITTAYALRGYIRNVAGATIDTAIGLAIVDWTNSGTITNSYGIYVSATIDRGSSSRYALYSLSTSPTLLTGALGVGALPTNGTLDVTAATTAAGVRSIGTAALGTGSGGGLVALTSRLPDAAGRRLGAFYFGCDDGTNYLSPVVLTGWSAEAWTPGSARGAYLNVETTAPATTTRRAVASFTASGGLHVGLTPVDLTAGYVRAENGLVIGADAAVAKYLVVPDAGGVGNSTSEACLTFDSSAGQYVAYFSSTAYVGIGGIVPVLPLVVRRTTSAGLNDVQRLWGQRATVAINDEVRLLFGLSNTGNASLDYAAIGGAIDGYSGRGRLVFYVGNSSATLVERMRISNTGGVHIGSTATDPGADNLNVEGVYKVDGTQVVSNRGAHVADATGAGDIVAQFNTLLARLEAHGLLASS